MGIALIILSIALWCAAGWLLISRRQLLAPAASYVALVLLSFAKINGIPVAPLGNAMLITWLGMVLIVMAICILQPQAIAQQTRGMGYLTTGAVTGMVVGLMASPLTSNVQMRYAMMILGTIIGLFLGYYLFTTTPNGKEVGIRSGRFFSYLLAKGFNVAITVIMAGLALTLIITV